MTSDDWNLVVAIVALIVATVSAFYSYRASSRANRIAVHDHGLQVLNTFNRFNNSLLVMGESNFDAKDALDLMAAAEDAKLYFPEALVKDLKTYSDAVYELLIARDRVKRIETFHGGAPKEKWNDVFAKVDRCKELSRGLKERLESELRLAEG